MTEKFQNKYRIPSARCPNWDYGWNASYFVTICTQNRVCYFGDIEHTQNIASQLPTMPSIHADTQNIAPPKMQLSEIGEMAHKYWLEIPQHFPFVILGEFQIMPNHVHGIIIIDKPEKRGDRVVSCGYDGGTFSVDGGTVETQNIAKIVETQNFASLSQIPPQKSPPQIPPKNKFGPQSQNLGSIIRGFKIGVTKNARIIEPHFAWQPRFHDHIIRNEKEYKRIENYIINDPLNWNKDKFYE